MPCGIISININIKKIKIKKLSQVKVNLIELKKEKEKENGMGMYCPESKGEKSPYAVVVLHNYLFFIYLFIIARRKKN